MTKPAPTRVSDATLLEGWGFDEGMRFGRAKEDMRVSTAPREYATPGCMIVYTQDGRRLHVDRRGLRLDTTEGV